MKYLTVLLLLFSMQLHAQVKEDSISRVPAGYPPEPQMDSIPPQVRHKKFPMRFRAIGILNGGYHVYDSEFYNAKAKVGFSVLLEAEYPLSELFAVNLGVGYDQNVSSSVEGTFQRNSLLVPMNLKFGQVFYISAGPYYKKHFSGTNGGQKLDFEQTFRKQEWGYQYGLSAELLQFQIGIASRASFQSIYSNGPKVMPRENIFFFSYKIFPNKESLSFMF